MRQILGKISVINHQKSNQVSSQKLIQKKQKISIIFMRNRQTIKAKNIKD
jgi:hypothetical protein